MEHGSTAATGQVADDELTDKGAIPVLTQSLLKSQAMKMARLALLL